MWLADVASDPLIDWLTRGGAVGVLAFIVVGFVKGWIVSGRAYDQARQDRDRALDLVYKQASLANRAVDLTADRLRLEEELTAIRQKEAEQRGPV